MARVDAVRTADNQCSEIIFSDKCHHAKHSQSIEISERYICKALLHGQHMVEAF
jgi:hypothetical protein